MLHSQVLDMIGSCGLSFRKPQPADQTAAPAVAAISSEAPPEELLQYNILTDSSGVRYDTLVTLQVGLASCRSSMSPKMVWPTQVLSPT